MGGVGGMGLLDLNIFTGHVSHLQRTSLLDDANDLL